MFAKSLMALAVGLMLVAGSASAEPSPALPRGVAPAEDGNAAFVAWTQNVMGVLERANRASQPFLQMNFEAESPEAARATLRNIAQQAATARTELARARAELQAMQPFTHRDAPPDSIRMSEILLRDSRSSVDNLDQLLADMIEFVGAIERGDNAEANRLLPNLNRGAVLLMRAQATTLRARQQLLDPATSTYHTVSGMASMYDGMAAIGGSEADLPALESAINSIRASLIAERAALALERITLANAHPNRAAIADLIQTRDQYAATNEQVMRAMNAAAQDIRSGAYNDEVSLEHLRALGLLELEYQRLAQRQIEIYALLSE